MLCDEKKEGRYVRKNCGCFVLGDWRYCFFQGSAFIPHGWQYFSHFLWEHLLGVLLWELGTCAMRLTKIAGKGERKEEKAEPKIKDPTEFSNK